MRLPQAMHWYTWTVLPFRESRSEWVREEGAMQCGQHRSRLQANGSSASFLFSIMKRVEMRLFAGAY
jgi:hypothetical protein